MTRAALALAVALIAAACQAPVRNVELTTLDKDAGYRLHNIDHGTDDATLVVVTMSGGGTRAAALAAGALEGLRAVKRGSVTLDQEIDIVSSVSGGSVTAAYYARFGYDGLETLKTDFLYQNVMTDLFAAGLNPVNLARLPTPSYSRIDWLLAAFRKRLFPGGDTYRDLLERDGRQPYLIVNAGDVTAETVFPFTQERFDLICSDLLGMELAQAVAASAAFPVALTALTLTNYSPCKAQDDATSRAFPPQWVIAPLSTSPYDNPTARNRAVREWGYLNRRYPDDYLDASGALDFSRPPFLKDWRRPAPPGERRRYIHLLDGGIADNLGLSEPMHLLSSGNAPVTMRAADGLKNPIQAICDQDITNLVFVVVNARSDRQTALDRRATPPGIVATLSGSVGSAIDGTTYGLIDKLGTVLRDLAALSGRCDPDALDALAVFSVPVDFDFIDDPVCRARFQDIATTWHLEAAEVDSLLAAGKALTLGGLARARAAVANEEQPVSAAQRLGLTVPDASLRRACAWLAQHDAEPR